MSFRPIVLTLALFSVLSLKAETLVLVAGGPDTKMNKPFAIGQDKDGNLYVPELTTEHIWKVDSKGAMTVFAGMGPGNAGYSGDGGPALQAKISWVHNLIVSPDNMVYIADSRNNCVRKIVLATNIISTFAGTGKKGDSGDGGPAAKAEFGNIYCIALSPDGSKMYVNDLDHKRIRVIDMKSGIVEKFAGNGKKAKPEDGSLAATSPLFDPRAVAADKHGNVYILERGGNALRVVDTQGKIRTVAGTGAKGLADGEALKSTFAGPKHICIDLDDSVIIADGDNHAVRKYFPKDGKVTTIAGTGKLGAAGLNGPPEKAQLNQPHGVLVTFDGTLYIADAYNNRVLKIQK